MKLFANTTPPQSGEERAAADRLRSVIGRSKGDVPPSPVPGDLIKQPKVSRRFWTPDEVEAENE
jgi:hypothetical protein